MEPPLKDVGIPGIVTRRLRPQTGTEPDVMTALFSAQLAPLMSVP